MNLNEIQDLIKLVSKSGLTEVEIEKKDFGVFSIAKQVFKHIKYS